VVKSSSIPDYLSIGVENTITKADIDLRDVRFLSHGATLGINAIIQTKGVHRAIVTNKGFRDIIELKREQRVIDRLADMYILQKDLPQEYVGVYNTLL